MNPDVQPGSNDWDPLSPRDVAVLFASFPGRWSIAGGWAIDLFIGQQTRDHADIDIQVDRRDIGHLHAMLPGWLLYLAHGQLTPWHAGEYIPADISNIWCRQPGGSWQCQLMLGLFTDNEWLYRRDTRIAGPIDSFTIVVDGTPVVAPEIQLLYKSRPPILSKDQHDFDHALPHLGEERRARLNESLKSLYGEHLWHAALQRYSPEDAAESPSTHGS